MSEHDGPRSVPDPVEGLSRGCADALECAPADSVIAGVTAALLHGLWLPSGSEAEPIHVATATPGTPGRQMNRTRRAAHVAHRYQLGPADTVEVHCLPVMSIERCWLDLAGALALPDLVAAGDSALRAGATVDRIREVVDGVPMRRGVRRARAALALLDPRSRSRPESHLRVAVHGISRIAFDVNEPVYRDEGGWLAEPDLSLAAAKLALEYQGEEHAKLPRMRKDLSRGMDLRGNGWRVIEYGPAEVLGRPWLVRSDVRSVLRERAPELLLRTRTRASGSHRRAPEHSRVAGNASSGH